MLNKMMMMILITTLFIKESLSRCSDGEVRLVGTPLASQGIVEVCINSNWGRVCRDGWSHYDATVVCKQLNYGSEGAIATLWRGPSTVSVLLDNVDCRSSEANLLDCPSDIVRKGDDGYYCYYGGYAGVKCREEQLRVKNVSATTVSYCTEHTVLVSWELYSNASRDPSSFRVQCFNRQHHIELFVNNGTLTQINIGDLFSSTTYACCVSAIYYGNYVTGRRCTSIDMLSSDPFTTPTPTEMPNRPLTIPTSTQILQSNSSMAPASISSYLSNMRANINVIGGVLGSIIVILLLVLAVCGGGLLYMLRSRSAIPKRQTSSMTSDADSTEIPNNTRYMSLTCSTIGSQVTPIGATDAAVEYSRIGPSYETIDSRRQQPVAGRNIAMGRLSERYEFSEAHLAAAGGSGVGQGETAMFMDYEVPLTSSQNEGHEVYSHLQR